MFREQSKPRNGDRRHEERGRTSMESPWLSHDAAVVRRVADASRAHQSRLMPVPTLDDRRAVRSRRKRPWLMQQTWTDLLFLHWRVPVEEVQRTLRRRLTVDTFDGDAWLGVVPFFMRRVHPRW